ncbi:MAG: hypothetical protein AAGG01_09305 [Planctomycetota bacterium]
MAPDAAAFQLDLPAKRKAKPLKKEPAKAKKGDDGTRPGIRKPGNVSNGRVGDGQKREILYGPDGKPIGEVVTTRQNAPGQGQAARGDALDLGRPRNKDEANAASGSEAPSSSLDIGSRRDRATSPGADAPAGSAGSREGGSGVPPEPRQPWEYEAKASAADEASSDFDPLTDLPSKRSAARFLFDRLQKVRRIGDIETEEITDHLSRLGENGLQVARYCLDQDQHVLAFAGARTLLIAGNAADADRVVARLRSGLPPKSASFVLEELIHRDPVRASTGFLAEMLRHRMGAIRRVARKALASKLTNDELSLLIPALESRSSDVRKAATSLLAGLDDTPVVTELLLERVVDRSSSVVEIAIDALARAKAGEPDFELLRQIFASGEILRTESLLILAVVEREDRAGRAIFTEQHVAPLLTALASPLPIVNASAAVALAGIGFRSEATEGMAWLNGPVPSSLITVATGATFFDGFSLVREPSLRRLRLISGVNYGNNGPDWADWWGRSRDRFQADRAVIVVGPEDAGRIVLRVDPGVAARGGRGRIAGRRPYVLAGEALSRDDAWLAEQADQGIDQGIDRLFISLGDGADLIALLEQEGVFGNARLPGPRGSFGRGGRSFEVQIGRQSKSFSFSSLQSQDWFDRILERTEGLARRSAWQRFPIEGVHAGPTDLFRKEASLWAEAGSKEEHSDRFLQLLVDHLQAQPVTDGRDAGVDALARLVKTMAEGGESTTSDAPGGEDGTFTGDTLTDVLGLVADEEVLGARARQLITALSTMVEVEGADSLRGQLVTTLHDRFGPLGLQAIAEILSRGGRPPILAAAVDVRPLLRVAAALNLGQGKHPEDLDLLVALLGDEESDVEIAAIAGLAERKAEGARASIWSRARASLPTSRSVQTRAAALRAVGMIGGAGALELLVAGLTETDARLHLPAAEGLASLGAPETSALLVSLLSGTSRQSIETVAKEGLLNLGEAAHDDLFAAMRSPDKELQRDAAVLLAQQLEPRAVPVLASTIAIDPDDALAFEELTILTCVDYSDETLPAESYFQWWDEVDHRSAFSWFAAALEQRGLRAPEPAAFEGEGTDEARLFLLTLIRELGGFMAERALRELERLHGERLGPVPVRTAERDAWFARVRGLVLTAEEAADASGGEKRGG